MKALPCAAWAARGSSPASLTGRRELKRASTPGSPASYFCSPGWLTPGSQGIVTLLESRPQNRVKKQPKTRQKHTISRCFFHFSSKQNQTHRLQTHAHAPSFSLHQPRLVIPSLSGWTKRHFSSSYRHTRNPLRVKKRLLLEPDETSPVSHKSPCERIASRWPHRRWPGVQQRPVRADSEQSAPPQVAGETTDLNGPSANSPPMPRAPSIRSFIANGWDTTDPNTGT